MISGKKKNNKIVIKLHRKKWHKYELPTPEKQMNILFVLLLPRLFSNEHSSGNMVTFLLPKSYQRLLYSYLSNANLQLHYYNYVVTIQLTPGVNAYCSCTSCSNTHSAFNSFPYHVCVIGAVIRPFRHESHCY